MSWPFPEYIRPLMRDILFWSGRGESWEQVQERLTGPGVRHRVEDVEMAMPEARRALYFAEALRRAGEDVSFARVWHDTWSDVFQRAYGRQPTPDELYWASTFPGNSIGLMFEVTVQGVQGFRWTPTINASWADSMEEVRQRVEDWFTTGLKSPPPPGGVEQALAAGGKINVRLIGGALVPRIEPTIG